MARRKDESLINNRKQKKARKVMFAVAFLLTLLCIGTGSYVQELDTVQVWLCGGKTLCCRSGCGG